MLEPRADAACAPLSNGQILVLGGNGAKGALASAELYDPAADRWTSAGDMAVARSGHTATVSPWGAILVVGGEPTGTVEAFGTNGRFQTIGKLAKPRTEYATAVLPNHKILIFGGASGNAPIADVEVYDADANTIAPAGVMMAARKSFAASTLYDGTVLISGGLDASGNPLDSTEIFDISKGASVAGPALAEARANHQSYTLPGNGSVMVLGGTGKAGALASSEVYTPWTGKFGSTPKMHSARAGMSASLLRRGGMLVAGGKTEGGYVSGVERYRFATVETGKLDYAPGETASFTGSGWKPGEQVLLEVKSFPLDQHAVEFTSVTQADSTGSITAGGFHIDKSHLGVNFLLTAKGSQSQALTLFSDAEATSMTLNLTSGVGVYGLNALGVAGQVTGVATNPVNQGNVTIFLDGVTFAVAAPNPLTNGSYSYNFAATDIQPGLHNISASFGNSAFWANTTFNPGTSYQVTDTVNVTITSPSPAGSVSLGTLTTFTATVIGANGLPATFINSGTVTFNAIGTAPAQGSPYVISSVNVINGSATASTTLLPANGSYTITASYSPASNSGLSASNSPNSSGYQIFQGDFTTGLSGSVSVTPASPTVGNTLNVSGAISGKPGITPTGSVNFRVDGSTFASNVPLTNGVASVNYQAVQGGPHSFTVDYSGDTNYFLFTGGSANYSNVNNPKSVLIGKAATTVSAVSNPAGPVNYGTPTSLNATVSSLVTGVAIGGTATFQDNGANIAGCVAQPVTNGLATPCTPSPALLPGVPHVIKVLYLGDTNFGASDNSLSPYNLVINPDPSSVVVSASPSTINLGGTVTFTATLSINNPGNAVYTAPPAGTITIFDGVTPVCTITGASTTHISAGVEQGTCTATYNGSTTVLGAGSHTLTASYNGMTNVSASPASPGINVTVNSNTLTFGALTPSAASPIVYNNGGTQPSLSIPFTLSGTVTISPTANFTVYDGLSPIGTVSPAASPLSFNLPGSVYQTVGTHVLSVKYPGDANIGTATSAQISYVVNRATATIGSFLFTTNPAFGTATVFKATVAPPAGAGAATPTGSLTFSYGGTVLGSCSLPACSSTGVTYSGTALPVGADTIKVDYNGDANYGTATDSTQSVTVGKNATTATLTASPVATAAFGSSVTLTAQYLPAASGAGFPSGTVTFFDGATNLGSALFNPSGVATFTTAAMVPGSGKTLKATWPGDTNFNSPADPTLTYAVTAGNMTVTLSSSLNPAKITDTVTYNFSVVGGPSQPVGTVALTDSFLGGKITTCGASGDITLTPGSGNTSTGTCVVTYAAGSTGTHNIVAAYTPTGVNAANWAAASSSTLTENVGKLQPTFSPISVTGGAVTSSCLPNICVPYGTQLSISSVLSPVNPTPAYTGAFSFTDNGATLPGTVNFNAATSTASITGVTLVGGSHTIKTLFAGDANYLSADPTIIITIGPMSGSNFITAGGTFSINTNPVNTTYGGKIPGGTTVTMTPPPSLAMPTGTVTLSVGAVTIGTFPLNAGVASLGGAQLPTALLANLPGFPQTLTITYNGDSNYSSGNAPGANQINVAQATPVIALGASPNASNFGQAVTFTVTAAPTATFLGQPTGFIDIFDADSVPTKLTTTPIQLSNGSATFQIASLTTGLHHITATYNGDTNFTTLTTSPALAQTVNAAGTAITLTPSTTNASLNSSVIYSFTVSGGSAPPSGNVTITDAFGSTAVCANIALVANPGPPANTSSGQCTVTYNGNNTNTALGAGTHQLTATFASNNTSNWANVTSAVVAVSIGKAPTSVSTPINVGGPATITYGTNVTFRTVVTPTSANPNYAIGTVQFYDNGAAMGAPVTPSSANGQADFTPALPLVAGTHAITAQFIGDANYAASVASPVLTFTVSKATPSPVTLTNPAPTYITTYGGLLTTGTANVPLVGSGVIPTGTVTLSSGGIVIATGTLDGSGNFKFTNVQMPSAINQGAGQNLTVTYSGDNNYSTATFVSTNGLTVNSATSTAVVTSAPGSPVAYGQNVTFTVTLAGPGNPATGTVSFTADGGAINATCTSPAAIVTANVATCTVAATTANHLSAGTHIITVTSFAEANSNHVLGAVTALNPFVVGSPAPQIVITSNVNPSAYGQAVTFTATVSGPAGAPAPIGQLQFFDGSATMGSLQPVATTAANSVTYTLTVPSGSLPILTGGTHAISATYIPLTPGNAPDPNYSQGSSQTQNPPGVLQQTVNRAPSVTTNYNVLAAVTPIEYGESIDIRVDITPSGANTGVPTGTVLFKDNGVQIGQAVTIQTIGLVQRATLVGYTALGVGTHAITAEYQGDTNFLPSTNGPNSLTIAIDPTKTTLGALQASPTFGATLTLNAQVCGLAAGSSTVCGNTFAILPGSTITFLDGSTVLGSVPVDGTGSASITVNMQAPPFATPAVGTHSITARYDGDARFATSTSAAGSLPIAKALTTTAVVSSANPSVTGQTVQFTATVNAPGSFATVAPTGNVTFLDGATVIGTAALVTNGGTTSAVLTVPSGSIAALTIGQHVIAAQYAGDAFYSPSNSPIAAPNALVQTVNKAATTTTLQSSSNASNVGQQITLTAAVTVNSPGSGAPSGSVQFINTAAPTQPTVIGTSPLIATPGPNNSNLYTATLNLATLPQGNPVLIAVYSGDNSYLTSTSSPLTQAVQKTPTNIVLTTSLSPSILGNQVTFAITVTPVLPGTGTPTGQINIYDGTNLLANATLQGGQYQYITSSLPVGQHAIGVAYLGDTNFQPFTSPTISQVVNKVPTTLNMTSNAITAIASQVLTFTAVLSPNPVPGVPFAQGQVGFYDGSNLMGVGNLQSNVATLNVSNLSVGIHQISAIYTGSDQWAGATSGFYPQTVTLASTNAAIVSSANPSVFGQPVTFTISVTVPFPGTVPATGQVQLYDNNNALGNPIDAGNGVFTATFNNFTPGTHSIIAKFLANNSFSGSQSATLPQVVNKAPTVTTLAALPNGTTSRQQVTMTAVIGIPTPGAGALTGSVQFADTTFNKVLGTAQIQLVGGVYTATLTTDQLTQSGSPQILVATYSGDANFASSSSNPQGQSVFGTQIAVVNGAGYTSSNFAADSWATVYGDNLASTTLTAVTTPYPTSLAGTTVSLTDSTGTQRLAPIYFVSPGQVNILIPSNTAFGLATVTVTNPNGATASSVILVTRTAPGLFTANASGQGVAAALVQRVRADSSQTIENVATFDSNAKAYVPVVIPVGSDSLYLQLYGTGIRYTPGLSKVTCTINGINAPVLYASAAPGFPGLDQVNVQVPAGVAGAGVVNVIVTVDGQAANTVTLAFGK
ncbi:MAG: Ig-like domain (Group 3) [Candidatus Solibacter sp.]|nr:Ig-like domain (Group 3) [Candidatus Solibacter sp.]